MKISVGLALILVAAVQLAAGAKILGIFPTAGKSHWVFGEAILAALGERGHEITFISPFKMSKPIPHRHIETSGAIEIFMRNIPSDIIEAKPGYLISYMILNLGLDLVDFTLGHKNVQQWMSEKPEVDLIIVEDFGTVALYGFKEYFNAPLITVSSTTTTKWFNDIVGTPEPWSYVPHPLMRYTAKMSFVERLGNSLMNLFEVALTELYIYPKQNKIMKKYFPNSTKSLRQVMREDVSLVFLNTHFSLSFPRPYVPNMIEIGGINIDRTLDTLPKDIQQFLDSAKDGAILFSMGSFLNAENMKPEQRSAFISAFSQLKQRVIWRYELPDAPQLPKNILAKDWLPQKEIMSHPNVKLFMTHGGMLGTTESVYYGLPMIGIPCFGDQHMNTARAELRGYALKLELNTINDTAIVEAVQKIFKNPKYTENAQRLSKIFRDQPMTPKETAVYWSEYVLNHKGAPHMKVEGTNLGIIQYHNLDVWAVLFLGFLLFVLVPELLLIRCLCRRFFGKTKSNNNIKIKKK